MKTKYINTIGNELYNIGEKTLVHNFTSITLSKAIAKRFAGANGYIYKIYLMIGKRLSAQNNFISSSGRPNVCITLGV